MIQMTLDPKITRQAINAIFACVDECRLDIYQTGWNISAEDPENVMLVSLNLPKESFLRYKFEEEIYTSQIDGRNTGMPCEYVSLGMDISRMKNFMSEDGDTRGHRLRPLQFNFIDHNGMFDLELQQSIFSQTMRLIPETQIRKKVYLPLVYSSDFEITILADMIGYAIKRMPGEHVTFQFDTESQNLIIRGFDEDKRPSIAKFDVASSWIRIRPGVKQAKTTLCLSYVRNIIAAIPEDKCISIRLGTDNPMSFKFNIGTTGSCEYHIAPRTES